MDRRVQLLGMLVIGFGMWFAAAQTPRNRTGPVASPSATDVQLVQRVIAARREYQIAVEQLRAYYDSIGDDDRARATEEELKQLHRVPKPAYIIDLDIAGPGLRPDQNVPPANDLFRKAMSYKDKGFGSEFTDNQIRAELLLQQVLQQYPTSNKCSDAAYHLAQIYESRRPAQYRRAAVYYERCAQWNPATTLDARLKAAQLYDRQLNDRNKAIEWYRAVLAQESDSRRRQDAEKRLSDLVGK